jgi:hypothetical protein
MKPGCSIRYTKALNELLELVEEQAPHMSENEYLKGCDNLKKIHQFIYHETNRFEDMHDSAQASLYNSPHPQLNLIFLLLLWVVSFLTVIIIIYVS